METIPHAWRNFLAPRCRVVPARAEFFVVPEECGQVRRALLGNLECGGVRVVGDVTGEGGKKDPYLTEKLDSVHVGRMLSRPPNLFSFSFEDPEQIEEKVFSKEFLATVDGECDAVAGWFKLHLDQNNTISSEPGGDSTGGEMSQWADYYLARNITCSSILDMNHHPTAMAL